VLVRIHVQNLQRDLHFEITPGQWDAAMERAGERGHEVSFTSDPDAGRAALAEAEALVGPKAAVRALFPAAAPRLGLAFCMNAGLDGLEPFDWLPPGAALLNNRGAHAARAGEYAIMALLMLAAHMPAFIADQRAERWEQHHAHVLAGRRLLVLGLGSLGGAAAERAAQFGMRVTGLRANPRPHPACKRVLGVDALDAALQETEFLLLATPLTEATRGILDRQRIGLLPPGACVVNIGRGALLDQDALCDALDEGRLGGAVLDVFTPEPVLPGHRLWTTRNLVMTPHVSADDPQTYNPLSLDLFWANVRVWRKGEALPNRFDTKRGY
jgi:glyoxylate/hydroxypyruvate reductase A